MPGAAIWTAPPTAPPAPQWTAPAVPGAAIWTAPPAAPRATAAPAPAATPTGLAAAPAATAVAATAAAETGNGGAPLRRRLVELGVPVGWIPDGCADTYRVLDGLLDRLPAAAPLALGPGQLAVLAGPAALALRAAERVCAALRLDATGVWAAGCGGRVPAERSLTQPWEAARLAARLRHERTAPLVAVVATDELVDIDELDDDWAAQMVRALAPDALWLAADAARKPADLRAAAGALGRVDALAVFGAARTTSPASVWELGVPVALLDGRRASRGTWTALLIDKLDELDR